MVERLEDRAEELETAWQEAQAANQMKSEFLATTSHELRTPLNAIFGCIGLVKDGCCDSRDEELELLQQADDSAKHLLNINEIKLGYLTKFIVCHDFSRSFSDSQWKQHCHDICYV